MARQEGQQDFARYATVGIEFIGAFGLCLALGVWADRRFGGGYVWTLVGAGVGFAAGMYRLMRVAREVNRGRGREDRR